MITWPNTLPRPERDTYQAQAEDPRRKGRNEVGPKRYRRRWSSVARNVTLSIIGGQNERAVFHRFYEDETSWGAQPFQMPDPTRHGWPLLTADGQPLLTAAGAPVLVAAHWLCVFGDQVPTETIIGTEFRINFSVVVLP